MKKVTLLLIFLIAFIISFSFSKTAAFALNCGERSSTKPTSCPSECPVLIFSNFDSKFSCAQCNNSYDPQNIDANAFVCPTSCPNKFGPGTSYPYGLKISCLDDQRLSQVLALITGTPTSIPSTTVPTVGTPTTTTALSVSAPTTAPPTSSTSPSTSNNGINIGQNFFFGEKGIDQIFGSTSSLVKVLLPNIYIITGLIFLVLLIFAGFGVIVSAGGGNPEGAKKSKAMATSAAIGLALVFCAYWLVQIVQFITGIKIFNPSF